MRFFFAFLLAVLAALGAPALAHGNLADENAVKAGFIQNFIKYTEWPTGSSPQVFTLCATAYNPLGGQLRLLENRSIGNLRIIFHAPVSPAEWHSCRAVFVAAESRDTEPILKAMRAQADQPVLTVSDLPGFSGRGGMIELRKENNRIRFIINLTAAEQAGLKMSSQMLKLAEQVLK